MRFGVFHLGRKILDNSIGFKILDNSIGFANRTFFVQLGFDRIGKSVILLTSPTTTEVTMTEDEIRDIAIRIVDEMVLEELLPDCIDTNDFSELHAQDIIVEQLTKSLNKGA